MKLHVFALTFALATAALAATQTANSFYNEAAFLYIQNRLPSAEIKCQEGLERYPNDQKLQMLLDRIREAKEEQKEQNKQNQEQNKQDQNQEQGEDQNQDENQDQNQQNQEQQGAEGESSDSENGSSESEAEAQAQGASSSSEGESSSAEQEPEQSEPEPPPESQGEDSSESEPPQDPGAMTPAEASQLLKDFDEQNGERKPWKPRKGQARPEKDW